MIRTRLAAISLAALLARCAAPPKPGSLTQVDFAAVPGWSADPLEQSLPALRAGCRRLMTLPPDTVLGGQGLPETYAGRAGQWAPACTAARSLAAGDAAGTRAYYQDWFTPYRIEQPALFTGYYEPEVRGALAASSIFRTPLLARPDDLVPGGRRMGSTVVPYWSRADIEAGRMGAAARPLLWLADPVDLFFLQIQGSGRIRLPDGGIVRVGYDGKNGRPYTPIGRLLIANGALQPSAVSMQSIRAWLAAHPTQQRAIIDSNEDYVFFRVLDGGHVEGGPPGALGVALQPGRSAAVDRSALPLGVPIFADTTDPMNSLPWQHLLMAQDVGSDIQGPARADVFLGAGELAAQSAGAMHQGGTLYVLLPRGRAK